jgi:hypothetical protein
MNKNMEINAGTSSTITGAGVTKVIGFKMTNVEAMAAPKKATKKAAPKKAAKKAAPKKAAKKAAPKKAAKKAAPRKAAKKAASKKK